MITSSYEHNKYIFCSVAGMKYMNAENIVHRDIKPGNIMKAIDEDGR